MQQRLTPFVFAMVALVGLLWGLNWPAVKFMLREVPPLTLRAAGFTGGTVVLYIVLHVLGHRLRPAPREAGAIAVAGVFVVFGFNLLTAMGQMLTDASRAAIIAYTMPAITAILASIFLRERLGWRRILAVMIGMAGLAVLASVDLGALMAAPAGALLMLGAALSWSIGNVLVQARVWSLTPLALTFWFFVVSTGLAWPLALWLEPEGLRQMPSGATWAVFAFHVAGPMATCYLLWSVLLRRLPATVAAISILTAPVVGVLSAVLLLGEPVSWQKIVALGLIVLSIAITLIARPTAPAAPDPA
ncbi:Threonine/homoserine efflux transporter RhtA [Roseovarius nanhaiticus]|uniref:Threonine/homoserine efflux transporter RhtA n=1 Tax=Roseovarius nanhaiticus TaxID=573024 RepID=A0A1N7EL41_9RHOB|nr:DMT family transporter [Roseovarius nanhaiticus]SEK72352.1 Threonine/homoserine efflux transporter RhtA [Roseovarius nanhaiticus]SIR88796.1 Threonine/homoserine efflux transporter RhtA [Roseovarius nanhaiticus]